MSKHKIFIKIAKEFSLLSKCQSKQVCALFVKDNRIISTGINGTPSGIFNCSDYFDKDDIIKHNDKRIKHHEFSDDTEIHAEMNGIIYAAKNGINLSGSIVYCTIEPCLNCIKHLLALEIQKIYYNEEYDIINKNKWYKQMILESGLQLIKIKI